MVKIISIFTSPPQVHLYDKVYYTTPWYNQQGTNDVNQSLTSIIASFSSS